MFACWGKEGKSIFSYLEQNISSSFFCFFPFNLLCSPFSFFFSIPSSTWTMSWTHSSFSTHPPNFSETIPMPRRYWEVREEINTLPGHKPVAYQVLRRLPTTTRRRCSTGDGLQRLPSQAGSKTRTWTPDSRAPVTILQLFHCVLKSLYLYFLLW